MRTVKQAALLLVLVALGSEAAPGPDCDGLNKTSQLQSLLLQVVGDWVLVWSVAVTDVNLNFLKYLTSSHVEFRLLDDNNTIVFNERNLVRNSCTTYITNITQTNDPGTFRSTVGRVEDDGNFTWLHDNAIFTFFETCSDCVSMSYKGIMGHYLLTYRREGHHRDVDKLKTAHSDYKKLAECVGLPADNPYVYDGVADFCHKKSAPEATAEQSRGNKHHLGSDWSPQTQ
uniref:Uncharacterized protein n=1 Tax=Mola mola TaxID=94237 RepID=A0A3Q3WWW0_MOLML